MNRERKERSQRHRRAGLGQDGVAREGEGESARESLFVTVSGLSRSIISRKVLLTALIFCFFYHSLLPLFFLPPFVLSLLPFCF